MYLTCAFELLRHSLLARLRTPSSRGQQMKTKVTCKGTSRRRAACAGARGSA